MLGAFSFDDEAVPETYEVHDVAPYRMLTTKPDTEGASSQFPPTSSLCSLTPPPGGSGHRSPRGEWLLASWGRT